MSQSKPLLSWGEFATVRPGMAKFGEEKLRLNVMYLATVKPDGYPRVHPFTPFIGSGHLFAFMEPTSPKGKDLQRNGMYSMHSLVTDMGGSSGEFQITGKAILVTRSGKQRDCGEDRSVQDQQSLHPLRVQNRKLPNKPLH